MPGAVLSLEVCCPLCGVRPGPAVQPLCVGLAPTRAPSKRTWARFNTPIEIPNRLFFLIIMSKIEVILYLWLIAPGTRGSLP